MSTSPPPTLSLHSCPDDCARPLSARRGAPPSLTPTRMSSHRPDGETLDGGGVGFHRGAGHIPSYHRMGIRQARGSWSVQTHLGSQTRSSFTSHHTLLFLMCDFGRSPGAVSQQGHPHACGHRELPPLALSSLPRLGLQATCPWTPGCRKSPARTHVSSARLCKRRAQQGAPEAHPLSSGSRWGILEHLPQCLLGLRFPRSPCSCPVSSCSRPAQALGHCPPRLSCRLHGAPRVQSAGVNTDGPGDRVASL